mgnify:CR=1 FL=1
MLDNHGIDSVVHELILSSLYLVSIHLKWHECSQAPKQHV